jgi:hypothetical protein
LQPLKQATIAALQRQLRQDQYHVFHFIGHGEFDPELQDGVLLFEDEIRRGVRVNGQLLRVLLNDHASLRLAILNACEGARTSRHDHFAGAAQSLVQNGIPAVIAMQFGITDKAAILFAQKFYSNLAEGHPIDAVLAETRKTIFSEVQGIEWGTPVLYMRSPTGRIFDVASASNGNGIAGGFVSPLVTPGGAHASTATDTGTAGLALVEYLTAKQNGHTPQEKTPRRPLSPDQEIFRQLYRVQACLSLLFYLDKIAETNSRPNLTELCQALGIPRPQRQHAYHGLEFLAAARLVDKSKITATAKVTYRISAPGHELVKKLSETILLGETRAVS